LFLYFFVFSISLAAEKFNDLESLLPLLTDFATGSLYESACIKKAIRMFFERLDNSGGPPGTRTLGQKKFEG